MDWDCSALYNRAHDHRHKLLRMLALSEIVHRARENERKSETFGPSHCQAFRSGLRSAIGIRWIETVFLLVISSTQRRAEYLISAYLYEFFNLKRSRRFEAVESAQNIAL